MLKPPSLSWPIRLTAFLLAVGLGLYALQFYVAGHKLAQAVASLSRRPPTMLHPVATPSEPGVVSVTIVPESKQKP